MARIRVLSALKIKQNLKLGMYADGLGLYLKVRDGNSKSWIFRYRTHGKLRDMGLGPFHTVSLAEAREKAEVCRIMRLKGLDPLEERRKEQQAKNIDAAEAMTFKTCAETYIATHKDGWKNGKHAEQWVATLQTYVYPVFKDKPVAAIDDALVLKVLQPIWKEKTETASRIRGRIERILDWARVMKYRTGDNPARWKGHLDHLLPKRSRVTAIARHAALPIIGDNSIADMALLSWIKPAYRVFTAQSPALADRWGNIARWMACVGARPAVELAMTRHEGSAIRMGRDAEVLA